VVTDGNLTYTSLIDAMYDATLAALARAGYSKLNLIVGETGWPSAGEATNKAATLNNACRYNNYVARLATSTRGTPRRKGVRVEAYNFEIFDEGNKAAGTIEPNWGLLREDGTQKYNVDWQGWGNMTCPPPPAPARALSPAGAADDGTDATTTATTETPTTPSALRGTKH
jgi:hypothetical protein